MAGREDIFQKTMNEGHSAAWDKNWEQAAAAYLRALAEFPESPKALNSYALALFQLEKYDEALKPYMRAARVAPEDPLPFEKIAQINERMGKIKEAVQAALYAAELYLKLKDVDKALENWLIVIQLNPDNLQARSRLALIHEKTGQTRQATIDYIAVASILQNSGNPQKALEILAHIAQIDPDSSELQHALAIINKGQVLPRPMRPTGGTGPLRLESSRSSATPQPDQESPDPIVEARQHAMKVFADELFDSDGENSEAAPRRGLSVMSSTPSSNQDTSGLLLNIGAAIDADMRADETGVQVALSKALEAGFNHPAANFVVGQILCQAGDFDRACGYLKQCLRFDDYALAARLLLGKSLHGLQRESQASVEYLEALKIADVSVAPREQGVTLHQAYEPLLETVRDEKDLKAHLKLSENVQEMLIRANWRKHLQKMRSEMPNNDGQIQPLAEIVIQAQSSQVIESMKMINELARTNYLRSAMDEAFHMLLSAPTYLPLHILIADLLVREDRKQEAISKLNAVAAAYAARDEGTQSVNILRRIVELAPMDLDARKHLIKRMVDRDQLDEAIGEYVDLADIYYRLAELDQARKTFATALDLARRPNTNRAWSVKLLQRMADIDLQSLDWRQAIQAYEQIRTIAPEDASIRETLIDLNLRLAQVPQAQAELDSFQAFLEHNQPAGLLPFLQKMVDEHPGQAMFARALAAQLHKNGRTSEAITLLDGIGEKLMDSGDLTSLVTIVNQILLMNPPNADQYRALLSQIST